MSKTKLKGKFPPRISWKADQTAILIGDHKDAPGWTPYLSLKESNELMQDAEYKFVKRVLYLANKIIENKTLEVAFAAAFIECMGPVVDAKVRRVKEEKNAQKRKNL